MKHSDVFLIFHLKYVALFVCNQSWCLFPVCSALRYIFFCTIPCEVPNMSAHGKSEQCFLALSRSYRLQGAQLKRCPLCHKTCLLGRFASFPLAERQCGRGGQGHTLFCTVGCWLLSVVRQHEQSMCILCKSDLSQIPLRNAFFF